MKRMSEKEKRELYTEALRKWGLAKQLVKTVEECGELIQECCKHNLNQGDHWQLVTEIADVEIMLEQVKKALKIKSDVEYMKEKKLQYLKGLVENGN